MDNKRILLTIFIISSVLFLTGCTRTETIDRKTRIMFTQEKVTGITTSCNFDFAYNNLDDNYINMLARFGIKIVKNNGVYFLKSALAVRATDQDINKLQSYSKFIDIETAWFENTQHSTKTWYSENQDSSRSYSESKDLSIFKSLIHVPGTFSVITKDTGGLHKFFFPLPRFNSSFEQNKFNKCIQELNTLVYEKNNRG